VTDSKDSVQQDDLRGQKSVSAVPCAGLECGEMREHACNCSAMHLLVPIIPAGGLTKVTTDTTDREANCVICADSTVKRIACGSYFIVAVQLTITH